MCFLSEERLFNLIVEFESNYPCCIYYASCQTPLKTELNRETAMYCSPDSGTFFETHCIKIIRIAAVTSNGNVSYIFKRCLCCEMHN